MAFRLLRPLDPDADGSALHAIFGDEESCRYFTTPPVATVEETIAQLKKWLTDETSWAIVEAPDGPALGRIAMLPRGPGVYEAACMVTPQARGRGLAPRALAEAIDYVFEVKNARRIYADIDPENLPSLRVFEKLGFQKEAHLREAEVTHIGVRDTILMGLLRTDPKPWRAGT